ncbi:MAG: hypothetical protein ACRCUH_08670 [Shewanella sp.]
MNDAHKLHQLTLDIIEALATDNLQYANSLADERLLLLESLCMKDKYSPELVVAVNSVLVLDECLSLRVQSEMSDIQRRLVEIMVAGKAAQLYTLHSK